MASTCRPSSRQLQGAQVKKLFTARTWLGWQDVYLKDQMVEGCGGDDPCLQGQKFYFISDETGREFEKQQGIQSK
jgi:hypothetical protein